MPLRDHFRPPLADKRSWDGFHAQWPAMIVIALNQTLPSRYVAEPQVHLGSAVEIDVATYEQDQADLHSDPGSGNGGVATAIWAPPKPTLSVATDLPLLDEYEVLVYDVKSGRRLVAAIELVSPANKDRPEHRRAFVAKCAGLLLDHVSVAIVDVVTTRAFNLYAELMDLFGVADPSRTEPLPTTYAAACRWSKSADSWLLETWANPLVIGEALPTLPLWLAENLSVPLELERSYEDSWRVLRLP